MVLAGAVVLLALLVAWDAWPTRPPRLEPGWIPIVQTIAGNGEHVASADGESRSSFAEPFGVAVAPDGSTYVSDAGNAHRIRRVSATGDIVTIAGYARGFADGSGTAAAFDTPSGIALDRAGNLLVADTGNHAIRRVAPGGVVTTVAGVGAPGFRDGPADEAMFNAPVGVAVDGAGNVLVADTYNDRLRVITPSGMVRTLAGSGLPGLQDGPALDARFDTPAGVAVDGAGRVYVADTGNDAVRVLSPSGVVRTLSDAVTGEAVRPREPTGIVVESNAEPDGTTVWVTDATGRVLEIPRRSPARVLAGSSGGFADGAGHDARFRGPTALALAGEAHLVVADAGNALLRSVAAPGRAPLRAPVAPFPSPRFDDHAFGWLPLLWPVDPMAGPHEIAGTLGEARGESGEAGPERFHAGIDVKEVPGALVVAARDGVVSRLLAAGATGTLNEWLSVGPLTYVHVRIGRDHRGEPLDPARFLLVRDDAGRVVRVRVRRGTRFSTGDVLGTVNPFSHVHLNVGWPGEERNPLLLSLVQFKDTVPPTIAKGGIQLFDEDGRRLDHRERGRVVVDGRVQIVVDAWDRVDANAARRRLGLYRLGYQVLRADGTPADGFEVPRETIRFDRLPEDPEAPSLVYAPGSGIPFYGTRVTRFLYRVTTTLRGGVVAPGAWDTTRLSPGDYILRVQAADVRGNEANANRDLAVTTIGTDASARDVVRRQGNRFPARRPRPGVPGPRAPAHRVDRRTPVQLSLDTSAIGVDEAVDLVVRAASSLMRLRNQTGRLKSARSVSPA